VGLVVVATLLQACSGDGDDGGAKQSDNGEVTTTTSTPPSETVQQAPDGIAEFVARGTRPADCVDLTEAPEQVSDPRAKWFITSRTLHAPDGFVSPQESVWIVTPPPAADGTGTSVLYSDVGGGPTPVDLDRTMVSVTRADDGGLYGISLGNDGTKIVSIAQDGTTTPVVELPDVPLAGSLLVDGGSFYLLDLTGFIEVDGPAPEQGVPVLAEVSPDGAVEHIGVASSGAYAGMVDGVSLRAEPVTA
jgi:dipeptidyl aminopeptidase/acylaminoacyl peptidase